MENIALLVVDIQNALLSFRPYGETQFIEKIKSLIETARRSGMEIIYVRHDGGAGSPLEFGSDGWQIFSEIAPAEGDRIFDKKFSSSFRGTGLKAYLDGKGITNLILVGMQTDYCIDTTCRVAFEFGYRVIIPAGATTTFDNSLSTAEKLIGYYERYIWNGRFADVLPVEEVICMIGDK